MRIIYGLILALFLAGCSTNNIESNTLSYDVILDGITNPSLSGWKTFVIFPMDKNINPADLQFKEYASYVSRALVSLGYVEADNLTNCDATILLGYGIGDPEEYEYSMPIFGQTGVASSYTTGNYNGFSGHKVANAMMGGPGFSSSTTYMPSYGITGSMPVTRTTYHRYVLLCAIKPLMPGASEADKLYWKLYIDSTGSSGDLRRVFPVMIVASRDYLGKNTQGQVKVSINETDPKINEIKGLSPDKNVNQE
ncbi:MAG: hypothetical protein WC334_07485 [Kiritimatiellales bacterium]